MDRDKVLKQGVNLNDVYRTIQAFMGGYFINYFNRFGRQWQVYVEAEGEYRGRAENVGQFYVRNNKGENVPLVHADHAQAARSARNLRCASTSTVARKSTAAPRPAIARTRRRRALEEVFKQTMPREMGFDYSGMSFQEQKAREGVPPAADLRAFAVVRLFDSCRTLRKLVVALQRIAQHAGGGFWRLFRAVAPPRPLSAFLPAYMVQIEGDVYSQIGLVMLIGLAAKNAILIVEFAKDQYEQGKPLVDAALEGARLRLRPILMTSFAFILGCVPLWTATGAGSVARQIMGTTVIGGMMAASAIGIFFVPGIFYLVEKWSGASQEHVAAPLPETPSPEPGTETDGR